MNNLKFNLLALRFSFVAKEPAHFPAGKSANTLRGAFGTIFRKVACSPDCPGARECSIRANCDYARMFEPSALADGPSGLADWPRPFVFRAMHLDNKTVPAGSTFYFDVHLFDTRNTAVASLISTFRELATEGIGANRARAELVDVVQTPASIYLGQESQEVKQVRVQFVTPTELKSEHALVSEPSFGVLATRIRDRISTLRELYGDGPLAIDFRGFGERAARVQMTRCDVTPVEVTRRSSRTGQVHSIGGFVGTADYEGDLTEFIPYLHAAQWTGVGRQTVWGKGEIKITCK